MGVEINNLGSSSSSSSRAPSHGTTSYHRLTRSASTSADHDHDHDPDPPIELDALHLAHPTTTHDDPTPSSTGELAGIYLGILNLFTTLPQFVGTFISMLVFAVLEPGQSPELAEGGELRPAEGVNAIAVCLFIGAVSALGAAWATGRLRGLYAVGGSGGV